MTIRVALKTMHKLLAIVPAYNEADCIAFTIRDLRQSAPSFDVVVVDDGSTDATAELARKEGAAVLQHPFNLGIGGAVQSGYQYALSGGYDVAVQVDGDGQHDAATLDRMLSALQGDPTVNMVTGSRFVEDDDAGFRSTLPRRIGIKLFARVLSLATGRTVTDPTSGLRMCDRAGIELFARDYPHDYPEVEAVLMVHHHQLNAVEVPVRMRERQGGESSIGSTSSIYYMVKVLLALFVGLLRKRPVVRAGEPAAISTESGL